MDSKERGCDHQTQDFVCHRWRMLMMKDQSCLYFLRPLRSFNICPTILRIFDESVVVSPILCAVVCWDSRLRVADTNRLNKLVWKAIDVVGMECDSRTVVSERKMLMKLQKILDSVSHLMMFWSDRGELSVRVIPPKCMTEPHRKSFLPVTIKL